MPESTRSWARGAGGVRCMLLRAGVVGAGGDKISDPRAGRGSDAGVSGPAAPARLGVVTTIGEYGSSADPPPPKEIADRDAAPGRFC